MRVSTCAALMLILADDFDLDAHSPELLVVLCRVRAQWAQNRVIFQLPGLDVSEVYSKTQSTLLRGNWLVCLRC